MKKTTLKEIAENLGISISTVSKALKDYPDVSKKTKKRVLELAKSLNFEPNSFAQSLRGSKSKTIGVIVPTITHYFFSRILDAILIEAEKRDYIVIIMRSNENFELEKKQIDILINKSVDGILISLTNETNDFEHLKKIMAYNIPLVQFDKITKLVNSSRVVINDLKASYDAVSHMIKSGCSRIAHFRGDLNPQNSIDRFIGYKKALENHDIVYDSSLVYLTPSANFEEGYENAKRLIEDHGTSIDAIYAITDLAAVGALKYLKEINIKIPDDIAVFGFSNWNISTVVTPSLSTVEQHAYKLGTTSASILFEEIDMKQKNIPIAPKIEVIDAELIIRDSTK